MAAGGVAEPIGAGAPAESPARKIPTTLQVALVGLAAFAIPFILTAGMGITAGVQLWDTREQRRAGGVTGDETARRRFVRTYAAIAFAALAVLLFSLFAALEGTPSTHVATFVRSGYVVLASAPQVLLAGWKRQAGILRLARPGSAIRRHFDYLDKYIKWCRQLVADDGEELPGKLPLVLASLAIASTIVASCAAPMPGIQATRGLEYGISWLRQRMTDGGDGGPATSQKPQPSKSPKPKSGADSGQSDRPKVTSCSTAAHAKRVLMTGVPHEVGARLVRAWTYIGRPHAGCPRGRPYRAGRLWWVELVHGSDGPALVAGDAKSAAFVPHVFKPYVNPIRLRVSSMGRYIRWGLGTMQVVRQGSSCELLQQYGDGTPVVLPPQVTTAVARLAYETRSYPWVARVAGDRNGTRYYVRLVVPAATVTGTSVIDRTVVVRTSVKGADGDRSGASARSCGVGVDYLSLIAHALEASAMAEAR